MALSRTQSKLKCALDDNVSHCVLALIVHLFGFFSAFKDPKLLLRIAHDVLSALSHLHEHHFVHRDIAARNLLLTTAVTNPACQVVVGDLGLAKKLKPADKHTGAADAGVKQATLYREYLSIIHFD